MDELSRADAPRTGDLQYHLGLRAGELAEYVLLAGDPGRSEKVAARFDSVSVERRNREIVTYTGRYRGMPASIMSTGMGPDNIEIVIAEALEITAQPTFIRIGSSGALQPDIALGDLVISTGAVRLENTTAYYVHDGYPAIAHRDVVSALEAACRARGFPHHVGLTATAPGFYAAQGRQMRALPVRYPHLADELRRQGVANLEMESSALFVLASLAGVRAGTICAVYAQRTQGAFLEGDAKDVAEARCIDAGLTAMHLLWQADTGSSDGDRDNGWASVIRERAGRSR